MREMHDDRFIEVLFGSKWAAKELRGRLNSRHSQSSVQTTYGMGIILPGVNLKVTPPGAMTPPLPGLFRALRVWLAKAEGGGGR